MVANVLGGIVVMYVFGIAGIVLAGGPGLGGPELGGPGLGGPGPGAPISVEWPHKK